MDRYFIVFYEGTASGVDRQKGIFHLTVTNGHYPNHKLTAEQIKETLCNAGTIINQVAINNILELSADDFKDFNN